MPRERPLVLVADDEPINRRLIQRRLENEGYEVITAEDGDRAVCLSRSQNPDLILMDVMMPFIDGFEACRLIKKEPSTSDIPVIFLSGRDETEVMVNGFSLGANDFIAKPFKAEELVARVSVALRLKRERDALKSVAEVALADAEAAQERAMTDALTGLYNRFGLQRSLAREHSESRRYGRELACLMIDLDNFKIVNDSHGHSTGDVAIRQVAQVLKEAIRGSDTIFRFGGEEFLVLLPQTSLKGAAALGEKIRSMAEEVHFGEAGRNIHLTLSVGVAALNADESGLDMINRADSALYRAKTLGRNRVETSL